MSSEKYPVYRNDIKYKEYIDPSRAEWNKETESDYYKKDTDNISYRIEECNRENGELIDLSNMDHNCLELFIRHPIFKTLNLSLQHIFIRNSNLNCLNNLHNIKSLLTLDISYNNLTIINKLPDTIEELIVNNNKIASIECELPNLKRFNGSHNKITKMYFSDSMNSIYLNDNPISDIPVLSNLTYLDISTTCIQILSSFPNLKYLDCSFTKITSIPEMRMLEHLVCNESYVEEINPINSLRIAEMINTRLHQLCYMKSLKKILYHIDNSLNISSRYKIEYVKKNKNNVMDVTFS